MRLNSLQSFFCGWRSLSHLRSVCFVVLFGYALADAQTSSPPPTTKNPPPHQIRARRFLAGRTAPNHSAAQAMDAARQQHAAMAAEQLQVIKAHPELSSLNAPWQP